MGENIILSTERGTLLVVRRRQAWRGKLFYGMSFCQAKQLQRRKTLTNAPGQSFLAKLDDQTPPVCLNAIWTFWRCVQSKLVTSFLSFGDVGSNFSQQLFFYQSYLQQNTSTILVDKQNDRSKILLFWRQISGNKPNLLTKLGYVDDDCSACQQWIGVVPSPQSKRRSDEANQEVQRSTLHHHMVWCVGWS